MTPTAADLIRQVSRLAARDWHLAAAMHGGSAVSEPSAMERALVDASVVLHALKAPHALIGGLAVAVHSGQPRATLDVDLAVRSDVDRERVIEAFVQAGFTLRGRFEHSVNFVHAGGDPVQLAFDPGFDPPIARAEAFRIAETEVSIVRREDLIALKERAAADAGRRRSMPLRDQADVELLRGDVPDPDEGW
jgi:hypothetical protein